ncbi:MAG: YqgE/AlgH family protein [Pseudomonadales bacterium]
MPGLAGSYFGDTLTYLSEHDEDGAMGLVINRPSELSLIELLAQLDLPTAGISAEVMVMDGGPVSPERGFILHTDDRRFEASLELGNGLMLSASREALEAIGAGNGPSSYLVALGYAGWGAGQLEEELKDNAWLSCPANLDVVFREPFSNRVHQAAAILGIDFRFMSGHAGHA